MTDFFSPGGKLCLAKDDAASLLVERGFVFEPAEFDGRVASHFAAKRHRLPRQLRLVHQRPQQDERTGRGVGN